MLYTLKCYRTLHATNTLRFRITRDGPGKWEVQADTTGGTNFISDGTFYDGTAFLPGWFGLMCRYTASNATKIWFDDLYAGPILHDTLLPHITETEAVSGESIRITLSEPVQGFTALEKGNYIQRSDGSNPDSVAWNAGFPDQVVVFLHHPMTDGGRDSLKVVGLADQSGNRMRDTIIAICYYQTKARDVLIDEIMADPEPATGLPPSEYAELFNRSDFPVSLRGWSMEFGSYSKPFASVTIPSKEYLIITKDSSFLPFGACSFLFTSSTSLSNEGTTLTLRDRDGHVIHSVRYDPSWYGGIFKEDGGWSLEMVDSGNPCGCAENWEPSVDASGGTPGRKNSVSRSNPDESGLRLLRAFISDTATLQVTFSEPADSLSMLAAGRWRLTGPDSAATPVAVRPVAPDFRMANLDFAHNFLAGTTYVLHVSSEIRDCAGNPCDTAVTVRTALPGRAEAHDVVINEILPDPQTGGSRFVELYNRSGQIIDLQSLVIAEGDTSGEFRENAVPLTFSGYLLFPGEYVAFTPERDDIIGRYTPPYPSTIADMDGFPVFGTDSGTVILARKDDLAVIDRVDYDHGMHYPLLVSTDGVSLERSSPELPSADRNNWHSAAESCRFGTPGYRNSHYAAADTSGSRVKVEPEIFTPDNDGRDDLVTITIGGCRPDDAITILIYDTRGRLIRHLAGNMLAGSMESFIWDGMTDDRRKAGVGFHILVVQVVNPSGSVWRTKRTIVVGG